MKTKAIDEYANIANNSLLKTGMATWHGPRKWNGLVNKVM